MEGYMKSNNKVNTVSNSEYKPNRQQRRMSSKNKHKSTAKHITNDSISAENKAKLSKVIEAIRKSAVNIKNKNNISRMYFCISYSDINDILVIRYDGNEDLKKSLGIKTDITLDNGDIRSNNFVVYTEVNEDNTVTINDGQGIYLDKTTGV